MKLAFYIGEHANDSLLTRAGWWITRLAQKGPYSHVTHVEAIHHEHADGSVFLASSSLRDGGVRLKRTTLDPANWLIVNVPQWEVSRSIELYQKTLDQPYDWRGALATVLPGKQTANRWFCNEWVAYPYLKSASNFGPHHLAAVCLSIGQDVTTNFFNVRKA